LRGAFDERAPGFGGLYAFRQLVQGGWLAILAAVAIVVLVIYWPRVVAWVERQWSSR
jgi:K+ transporter